MKSRRYCEAVDPASPHCNLAMLEQYTALVCGEVKAAPAPAPKPPAPAPRPVPAPVATPPVVTAVVPPRPAEVYRRFARMRRCPHWTSASDCGCGTNRCAINRGDRGRVGPKDCFECPDLPPEEPQDG